MDVDKSLVLQPEYQTLPKDFRYLADMLKSFVIYILIFIASICVGSGVNPVKKAEKQISPIITDPSVVLDLNKNGKIDFWRFYNKGRVETIKVDRNEDGHLDLVLHFSRSGQIISEKYDRNLDGKFDSIKQCKPGHCVRLSDLNYNGKAEVQVIRNIKGKYVHEIVYISPKDDGKYIKKSERRYKNHPQASGGHELHETEAGFAGENCDGDCRESIADKIGEYLREIEDDYESSFDLSLIAGKIGEYSDTLMGVLIHESCRSKIEIISKSLFDAIKSISSCLVVSKKNYFDVGVKTLSVISKNNPLGKRLKVHCDVDLGEDTEMVATHDDSTQLVRTCSRCESVSFPAIGVNLDHPSFSRNENELVNLTKVFFHEMIHLGDHKHSWSEVDKAFACQHACFSRPNDPYKDLAERLCGSDNTYATMYPERYQKEISEILNSLGKSPERVYGGGNISGSGD